MILVPSALVALPGLSSLLAATPSPTPVSQLPDASSVTPGLIGFLATFAIVVATVLLLLDMVRRVRRLRYREAQAEKDQETHDRTEHDRADRGRAQRADEPPA